MPRGIDPTILAALDSDTINGIFYLTRITYSGGVIYSGEREIELGGNTYSATLQEISGIPRLIGEAGEVELKYSNVDGAFTTIDRMRSLLGAKVEIIEYLENVGWHVRWTGWADDFREIDLKQCKIVAYSGAPSTRTDLPRRTVSTQCPHRFNNHLDTQDLAEFDGHECPYRMSATVGFVAVLKSSINGSSDPVTFDHDPIGDGQTYGDAATYHVDDEILIGSEILRITTVDDSNTITCARAQRNTTKAAHNVDDLIYFSNCLYSVDSCKRRGMYGNNTSDVIVATSKRRNYFGGFPTLTGQISGRFRTKADEKARWNTITFGGSESSYGKAIPLCYGHCRLLAPIPILAVPEGDFLSSLFVVSEGPIACNPTDAGADTPLTAYAVDADGRERCYVNGAARHDRQTGYGIAVSNGHMDQIVPPIVGVDDIEDYHWNLNGSAWVFLRISTKDNPSVDPSATSVDGDFELLYGKCVYVYTDLVTSTFKATTSPVWVLLDYLTSKRCGGAVDVSRFDLQSFLDVETYRSATVTSVTDGSSVTRWTFNGIIDSKKTFEDWQNAICLGMYCLPPFEDKNGKLKIKALKSEVLTGLPLFTSKSSSSRNILATDGVSSLVKKRKSALDLPNEVRVNFVSYDDTDGFLKTQLVLADREAQTQIGSALGDSTLRVVSKSVDLVGTSTVDEAARIGTLILRAGEFAKGGQQNNLEITFKAFYKTASDLEFGDIIQVEDDLLDPTTEVYFRVIGIDEGTETVESGGIVLIKTIKATLHSNDIYDDTAFTCTESTRLNLGLINDTPAPRVTSMSVVETGVLDSAGVPKAKLTFTYTLPSPLGNFKDVVVFRSLCTGVGHTAIGDWRFVTKLVKGTDDPFILVDTTKEWECYALVSESNSGLIPSPDMVDDAGDPYYPRTSIMVDGVSDALPSGVQNLEVVAVDGEFRATWDDPATGMATADFVIEQWSEYSDFSSPETFIFPYTRFARGFAPNKTYYFRFAVHNKSGITSHADTVGIMATGAGPWVFYDSDADNDPDSVNSDLYIPGTDPDVPNAPVISVVVGKLSNDSYRFDFGAERPTVNSVTAFRTQFQIAKGADTSFTSPVLDMVGASPMNGSWITTELNQYHFRARTENGIGYGAWSATTTLATQGVVESVDTDVPSEPLNVIAVTDDVDPGVAGKELVVEWERPADNTRTLFAYAIQVHDNYPFPTHQQLWSSATGEADMGSFSLYDANGNFTSALEGRTVWIHAASPMTEANLRSTGLILDVPDATHLTLNTSICLSGTSLNYQIIIPDWEQTTRSITVEGKATDPMIQDNTHFRKVITNLELGSYYVRVKAANLFGIGAWSTVVGPVVVDGLKGDDFKNNIITPSKIALGYRIVEELDTLPSAGDKNRLVIINGKLYRDDGTSFSAAVPSTDISGLLLDAQIASLNATKLAGQITTTQIQNNCITTPKIQVGSVDAGRIASGAIYASHLTADCVVAGKIAANAITAREISANSITADKIVAGSITAAKMSATAIDGMVITGATLQTSSSGQRIVINGTDGIIGYDGWGTKRFQIPLPTSGFLLQTMGIQMTANVGGQLIIVGNAGGNDILLRTGEGAQFDYTSSLYLGHNSDISLSTLRTLRLVVGASGLKLWNYSKGIEFTDIAGSPPSTPAAGGILYVQSGALKYIGSSGTVTPLADA